MAYQVTFTLNSAYTGTTQADDFTIVAKHSGGSPADDTLATGVTKANLIAGVTYTVADTVTGGTVTSTGVCTNSVTWSGLNATPPTPTATPAPTATAGPTLYTYYVTTFVVTADPDSTFCNTNYTATGIIKSESSSITGMLNGFVYDSNDDPFIGSVGSYAYISTVSGASSNDTNNDPRYAIEVSNVGQVDDIYLMNCNGGGGPL